ncbi:hypothetical protein M422DRAFT_778371, partial [Sphaerobolus stellatus SS14]
MYPSSSGTSARARENAIENKRFFALIIGINNYESKAIRPLQGSVSDAKEFYDYLVAYFHVSGDNIKVLVNDAATRCGIIAAFRALATDPRIRKGDPIVIFYAGHGAETYAPRDWECGDPDRKIQMIMPHDFTKQGKQHIHAIPDRTIGALLDMVAQEKGDNITVIFDCCYSGSGTREDVLADDPTLLVRSVDIDVSIPSTLDDSIWMDGGHRATSFPTSFRHKGLRSHVLLAACGAKEIAQEIRGRGIFTRVLLNLLRKTRAEYLTYSSVLEEIEKLENQNPQCEGVNRDRILFNLQPPPAKVHYSISKYNHQYILAAGEIHGVSKEDEFTMFRDRVSNIPQGVLKVQSLRAFSAVLSSQTNIRITEDSVLLKTKTKEALLIQVPWDNRFLPLRRKLFQEMEQYKHIGIRLIEDRAGAKLGLTLTSGNWVGFDVLDPIVRMDGITRLPHTVSLGD